MHNTPLANAEFQLQFSQTNLAYLLGSDNVNPDKIREVKEQIEQIKLKIAKIRAK